MISISKDKDIVDMLDETDKEKLEYFAKILLKQKKYRQLKQEISERRKEIQKDEILTHDEFWKNIDV